jgi:hypothetical protein
MLLRTLFCSGVYQLFFLLRFFAFSCVFYSHICAQRRPSRTTRASPYPKKATKQRKQKHKKWVEADTKRQINRAQLASPKSMESPASLLHAASFSWCWSVLCITDKMLADIGSLVLAMMETVAHSILQPMVLASLRTRRMEATAPPHATLMLNLPAMTVNVWELPALVHAPV